VGVGVSVAGNVPAGVGVGVFVATGDPTGVGVGVFVAVKVGVAVCADELEWQPFDPESVKVFPASGTNCQS
jgi:hypothetical protein